MAEFTDIEIELLERIADDRLRTNLAQVREAAEGIWAADAPRIIHDFTDHGMKHSERLASHAAKLLASSTGHDLCAEEMYLLLAGVYLHDIGMQCDVVRFPEIAERAKALGAQFDIEFTAQTASTYSTDEQKALRKNHHFLAAAWIDYANRSGETVLGPAAKSIQDDRVDDLMGVCMYHAKLPITDCPHEFTFDPNGRKQLVAALLRFADEMDVDGHRVSIETVKNFNLDPHNRIYWWLHNRTRIDFIARNVIRLTIHLHPDDYETHGGFVHTAFIDKFRVKNQAVLTVLGLNNIPIIISHDSSVVKNDRSDPLPDEIVLALQEMQQVHDPLAELAGEVQTWLIVVGYEVGDIQQTSDHAADMVATLGIGTVKQRILVRCIDGEITSSDVLELDGVLDRRTPQGWLISDRRVSNDARQQAATDDAFRVFNFPDFLAHMVWGPYFDALTAQVERDRIPSLYVDLGCYKIVTDSEGNEIKREQHEIIDDYIDRWLAERTTLHISLLGEFGTGKTWFCRHYAYQQLQRYLDDPVHQRLPLLINLRDFTKAVTVQQLVNDALLEKYRLPFVGSASDIVDRLNRQGKLLLILDGFDEMALKADYQTVVDNFWELASIVTDRSKVLLTSRTEYFRFACEAERILRGEAHGRATIGFDPPKFEMLYLESFSDEQIKLAIEKRLGTVNGRATAQRVLDSPNLQGLARKPVLVELLLAALEEVSAEVLTNPAQVYLHATNALLLRNIMAERTFTSTEDKLYFLCELAWEMIQEDDLSIHYEQIPERIREWFGDKVEREEIDHWDFDLRNQTLLQRNFAGEYEFAHRSLGEFFVAFKFAAELGCLGQEFATAYCEADGELCDLPFESRDLDGLSATFGRFALSDQNLTAVLEMVRWMIDDASRLWQLLGETKHRNFEEIAYVGGNVATLLNRCGEPFVGADLSHAEMTAADLMNANLSNANLRGAVLHRAELTGATLSGVDLYNADLRNLKIDELGEIRTIATSPNQPVFACGGSQRAENRGFVQLCEWEQENWQPLLPLQTGAVSTVAYNSMGEYLACGTDDGVATVWVTGTRKSIFEKRLDAYVAKLTWAPDRNWLVASKGPTAVEGIEIWEIPSGKIIAQFSGHGAGVSAAALLPGGKWAISCDFEGIILLWEVGTGKVLQKKQAAAGRWERDMTIDPQGTRLIYGRPKGDVFIAELPAMEDIVALKDSPENFSTLQFSPDGTWVVGCSEQGEVKVWRSETGDLAQNLPMDGNATSVCFSSDGKWLLMALTRGRVSVWDVSSTPWQEKRVLEQRLNCLGAKIGGELSKGLKEARDGTTLKAWLLCRGAEFVVE